MTGAIPNRGSRRLTSVQQLLINGAQHVGRVIRVAIVVVAAVALVTCSGNSDASTARFEVTQIPGEGAPGATFEGIGDFAARELSYTLFFGETAVAERLEFGNGDAYSRSTGEDVWSRRDGGSGDNAATSFRNNLAASPDALEYLRSIANEVTQVGTERVRGVDTTHYRATVRLAELGALPGNDSYPMEVWVDEHGRTRRYRSQTLGTEEILVWEFFDFGVDVELMPPPPDKVQ